jgi:hypothetical protein
MMKEYLYGPSGWNLPVPKLIISVVGSTMQLVLPARIKKAFKRGLVKAAMATDAWIITSGINSGVSRCVGEAVGEQFHNETNNSLILLSIAHWGDIAYRDQLIVRRGEEDDESLNGDEVFYEPYDSPAYAKYDLLEPNHNHFVLVDDGCVNRSYVEIEFRTRLESELKAGFNDILLSKPNDLSHDHMKKINLLEEKKSESIPMVLIVVQGGASTLDKVEKWLTNGVPILILAV